MNEEKRKVSVRIVWKNASSGGAVGILNGVSRKIGICAGEGECESNGEFSFIQGGGAIKVCVEDARIARGSCPTLIHIERGERSFTFILRDALFSENPIYIPEYGVIVTVGDDQRGYSEIAAETTGRGEEIVCRYRIEVVNTGGTSCYSRIKTPYFVPNAFFRETFEFDPETGFLKSTSGNARVATFVDGVPAPDAFSPFQFRTTNTFRS
ncbi:MAG: hypothetical protein GXP32_04645 [Kiritimatiellaeota bacterium]|nr:hypothetical protein [Kiritimatiellota bacterium]